MKNLSVLSVLLVLLVLLVNSVGAFTGPTAAPPNNAGQVLYQSSGNVGIGTTTPSRRLDVASDGSNWISGIFAGAGGTDKVVIGNLSGKATIGAHNSALSAWADLTINQGGGNVGIATTSPSEKLQVYGGNIKADSFIGTISSSLSAVNVTGPSAFGTSYGTYNYAFPAALAIGSTSTTGLPTEGLYVKGKVGIGTTTPDSNLEVTGTVKFTNGADNSASLTWDPTAEGNAGALTGGYYYAYNGFRSAGNNELVLQQHGVANNIKFNVGGANTKMIIDTSGNVGIGTTTPATTLVVNGTTTIAAGSLVFPDGTKQTSALPAGTVIFYDGTSCPTGWTEFTGARGRVVVGLPSGGTLGGTVGTALTDLQAVTHTHDLPIGFHSTNWWITANPNFGSTGTAGPGGSTGQNIGQMTRLKSYNNNETSTLPYIQLLVCKKS